MTNKISIEYRSGEYIIKIIKPKFWLFRLFSSKKTIEFNYIGSGTSWYNLDTHRFCSVFTRGELSDIIYFHENKKLLKNYENN